MRAYLTLLSLTVALPSLYASDRIDWTENDYWENTQLEFKSLVHGTFNQSSCSKSVRNVLGCVAGINKMRQLENPAKKVLVKLALDGSGEFHEVDLSELTPLEYLDEYKAYLKGLKIELEKIGSALSLMPFNVENQVANFEKNYVTVDNDSMGAGLLYNEYLKIARDPHSYLVPMDKQTDRSQSSTEVKVFGIEYKPFITSTLDTFIITNTVEGAAAEAAGIKPGDIIVAINGITDKEKMTSEMRNNETLTFNMLREEGADLIEKEITVSRGRVAQKNVSVKVVEREGKKYGLIELKSFMSGSSCSEIFRESVKVYRDVSGYILDLRNNGGGRVDQAQCIMSLFLEPGSTIWGEREVGSNTIHTRKVFGNDKINFFKYYHNVVLVNGYSASASEATARYLKDYRKAFIVGERTFGKGSMQGISVYPENTKILQAKTEALYYGPKGISPQERGVMPEFYSPIEFEQKEPTPYVRESDRYTFPIKDKDVNPADYVDAQRLRDIEAVKNCQEAEGNKAQVYSQLSDVQKALFDNQLEDAVEVIECANKLVNPFRDINIKRVEDFDYSDTPPLVMGGN